MSCDECQMTDMRIIQQNILIKGEEANESAIVEGEHRISRT